MNRRDVALGVVVGLVVGLVLGAAAIGGLGTTFSPTEVSMTVETATGCVPADAPSPGTVGVVPVADGTVVDLNVTLVHEVGAVNVSTDLVESRSGTYVLALEASPDRSAPARKSEPPADCQPRTLVRAAGFVTDDVETLRVVYNGTEVASATADAGFARVPVLHGSRVSE